MAVAYTAVYPATHDTAHVKATTYHDANQTPWDATDPAKSLIGSHANTNWYTTVGEVANTRFHIDLDTAKIIRRIYYESSHHQGGDVTRAINNFVFQGSNTGAGTFDDLVYGNDEGWTTIPLSQNTMDAHIGADQADPKYILVNNWGAYRYYAFKIADNGGDATFIGARHLNLQTQDGYQVPSGSFFHNG
ncbi:hypothetical protein CMI37_05290 [Candidatus Pacearchaeota archaeon]|nr:hypothetical protein [Candidatus Pacearchaeota archaeon]